MRPFLPLKNLSGMANKKRISPKKLIFWELVFRMGSLSEVDNMTLEEYNEAVQALRIIRKREAGK